MAFLGKEFTPTAVLECDPTFLPKNSLLYWRRHQQQQVNQ